MSAKWINIFYRSTFRLHIELICRTFDVSDILNYIVTLSKAELIIIGLLSAAQCLRSDCLLALMWRPTCHWYRQDVCSFLTSLTSTFREALWRLWSPTTLPTQPPLSSPHLLFPRQQSRCSLGVAGSSPLTAGPPNPYQPQKQQQIGHTASAHQQSQPNVRSFKQLDKVKTNVTYIHVHSRKLFYLSINYSLTWQRGSQGCYLGGVLHTTYCTNERSHDLYSENRLFPRKRCLVLDCTLLQIRVLYWHLSMKNLKPFHCKLVLYGGKGFFRFLK